MRKKDGELALIVRLAKYRARWKRIESCCIHGDDMNIAKLRKTVGAAKTKIAADAVKKTCTGSYYDADKRKTVFFKVFCMESGEPPDVDGMKKFEKTCKDAGLEHLAITCWRSPELEGG